MDRKDSETAVRQERPAAGTVSAKRKGSGFMVQGAIYAASGIISSFIGLLYRLPLTRIIGDEGNGYYSAAFNIYTIILLLSSYSLPLAVSKMVSARIAKGGYRNARRILTASLVYATVVGGIGCTVIWTCADWFANHFLHIPMAALPMRALAPTVWIVSYLGVLRGYWQGHSTMVPTALSQVVEQIVNAVVSVSAAWILLNHAVRMELDGSTQRAFGAMGGTIGTGAGAFAALIVVASVFWFARKQERESLAGDADTAPETFRQITRILFLTAVPVIMSTAIYNMGSILDNALFGQCMYALGQQDHTAADYGIYAAKYKLLINVPVMVANSLGTSLVPALSRANAAGDQEEVNSGISGAIRFTMIVAIPSAIGLAVMAGPVLTLLFGRTERAVQMMTIGSFGVVFYSLSTVSNAILQGTSHMRLPVQHALISLVIHIAVLLSLLLGARAGIFGVVIADMCFALCMCLLNAHSMRKLLTYHQEIRRTFILPLFCALIMGAVAFGLRTVLEHAGVHLLFVTVLPIAAAVLTYAFLLLRTGAISEAELKLFPKGTKLVRIARKLHLFR